MIHSETLWSVICDGCGEDGGSSRPTRAEALEYGAAWEVGTASHYCDTCRLRNPEVGQES